MKIVYIIVLWLLPLAVSAQINIQTNFKVNAQIPLDMRVVFTTIEDRDALNPNVRYEGLTVYVLSDTTSYQLIGGITNDKWRKTGGLSMWKLNGTDIYNTNAGLVEIMGNLKTNEIPIIEGYADSVLVVNPNTMIISKMAIADCPVFDAPYINTVDGIKKLSDVDTITIQLPLKSEINNNNLTISIPRATETTSGYLHAEDFARFDTAGGGTTYTATNPIVLTNDDIAIDADTLSEWRQKQNEGATAYSWGNHAGLYLSKSSQNDTVKTKLVEYQAVPANSGASGDILMMGSAMALQLGDVVFVGSSGGVALCKADQIENCPYAFAIVIEAIEENGEGYVMTKGTLRNNSWDWSPGALLYVKNNAVSGNCLTETPPSSADNVIMPVAVALASDVIYFGGNLNTVEKK